MIRNQSNNPPISISSSSSAGGGGGGAGAPFPGLSAFLSATGASVAADGAPELTDPKKSVTDFPIKILEKALIRLSLAFRLAAAKTAFIESGVTSAPWDDNTKAA